MNQITTSNYQGLYNNIEGQIDSNPNSVIVSDANNNIVSTNDIDPYISLYSININKIDTTNIPSAGTYLQGNGSWTTPLGIGSSGFGSNNQLVFIFTNGGFPSNGFSWSYISIGNVVAFSFFITSLHAFTGANNQVNI